MTESYEINALRTRSQEGTITPQGEAWLIGYETGQTHAIYVDAYGGDMDSEPESAPGRIAEDDATLYVAGYMQGVEDWKNEQHED